MSEEIKATPDGIEQPEVQPQTANVDIDKIVKTATREAEKKLMAVFQSMLSEQGFDNDSIKEMTKEWKAKRTTPEQALKEKDGLIAELQKKLEETANKSDPEKDALKAELSSIKQQQFLQGQGVPADMIEFYQFKIGKLVTDDTNFETAGAEFLKNNPLPVVEKETKETPPPYVVPKQGTVKSVSGMSKEDFKKLSYMDKLKLKNDNPTLYEKMFN